MWPTTSAPRAISYRRRSWSCLTARSSRLMPANVPAEARCEPWRSLLHMNVDVDPALVERYIFELARHGAHGETGVWRTVYSPEWVAAQDQVGEWLADAGLEVRSDAVG